MQNGDFLDFFYGKEEFICTVQIYMVWMTLISLISLLNMKFWELHISGFN